MSLPTQFLTVFVLAGGKSSRMGSDKAFLELAGRPLIGHAMQLGASVSSEVRIVGSPEKFAPFGMVVPDIYSDRGPLGGIHAALMNSGTPMNLILGVDLPFMDSAFLPFLISTAQSSNAVVTVPSCGNHLQTLCAVYRKDFGEMADRALAEGRNKIDALFSNIPVRVIEEKEIKAAGFNLSIFRNLNTPEEWEASKRDFALRETRL
jgi:molybdopterin-guanine dinucleotide biosynthesis protein A